MITINLSDNLSDLTNFRKNFVDKLKKLNIETVRDLLWHFPFRYEDFSNFLKIVDLKAGQQATIQGVISSVKVYRTWKRKMFIVESLVSDDTGSIKAVWFNQRFLISSLKKGKIVNLAGKITEEPKKGVYLSHPVYEILNQKTIGGKTSHTGRLVPIYPETKGLTSRAFRFLIKPVLEKLERLPEFLPFEILKKYNFPEINAALNRIHFPQNLEEAASAKKRFAFEDLFLLQLANLKQRLKMAEEKSFAFDSKLDYLKKRLAELPFNLTHAQKKALWEILKDLNKPHPMNRLLQGDVGSGKTIVAGLAALAVAENGKQSVFMAPTEVLARQHYGTFKKFFSDFDKGIALIVSGEARIFYGDGLGENGIKKGELIKKIADGKIKIVIGTHALIQKSVSFGDLGFVVVDEQHRFGVRQRAELIRSKTTNKIESTNKNNFSDNDKIVEKELSYKLGGIFFRIQEEIGRFCRERQYADLLEKNLKKEQIDFKREYPIEVRDRKSNFVDFIVENRVLIDLKAKPFIEKEDYYQMKRYLEIANLDLGLIVNFQDRYLKPKRVLGNKKFVDSDKFVDLNRCLPHFLSMSATPIPRTLSLAFFGDLDLSIIDELPKGRKEIITKIVSPQNRDKAYAFIRAQIGKGRQAFVICPRIDPQTQTNTDYTQTNTDHTQTDAGGYQHELAFSPRESVLSPYKSALLEVKAVKEEYEKLSKKVFPDLRVAMLHGKMKTKEKAEIMNKFKNGEIDILVSTSVIEVGVDVPNATIMLIEGTECFGLAQLYQFRGRVGRGEYQSFCFLFTESSSRTTYRRLRSLIEAKNGFELAEKDLEIRGPGEVFGAAQTGMPDLAMKAIQNPDFIKNARQEAVELLKKDPELMRYPLLLKKLESFREAVHLE